MTERHHVSCIAGCGNKTVASLPVPVMCRACSFALYSRRRQQHLEALEQALMRRANPWRSTRR